MAKDTPNRGRQGANDPSESKTTNENEENKKQQSQDQGEELSEEDKELMERIELSVQRTGDPNPEIVAGALDVITKEIKSSTRLNGFRQNPPRSSSLSSVPKPLKFLRPHYDTLKENLEKLQDRERQASLADVISLLAMTKRSGPNEMPESLKYRLKGSGADVGQWGHEYVRNLAAEVGQEYTRRQEEKGDDATISDLMDVVKGIVRFHMEHNAEPEAVDLLLELDCLHLLADYVTSETCSRVGLYLITCGGYLPEPDDNEVLEAAHKIYMMHKRYPEAMRTALKMKSNEKVQTTFNAVADKQEKRQLAYMLARHGHPLDLDEGPCKPGEDEETLKEIMSNGRLSEFFLSLARDLDVMEPKTPEDIYKSHLVEGRQPSSSLDSAIQNLSSTFVSGFVNAAFGQDKMMTVPDTEIEGNIPWVYKNKDRGRTSAAASLGLVTLWDVEGGLPQIDKYLYAQESDVVAGALMAVGIVTANVRNEADPAYALLHDSVNKDSPTVRIGAILGLGIAYAGTAKEDIYSLLSPIVEDAGIQLDIACFAAITIGLVFVGTCHEHAVESILTAFMTRGDLDKPLAKLMTLGLGLLFLGSQTRVEATMEVAQTVDERISRYLQVVLEACAYAGTGNVIKVQQMLEVCGEQIEENDGEEWRTAHQMPAVLGMALIAMGEDLGSDMCTRTIEHLLQYGEGPVRKACPLALALLATSNPKVVVTDTLSRLSHDSNTEVAQAATLAIGLVTAGTNNARVAGMLRQLTSYYYKDPSLLFLVRVSQGLTHLGKGLLTLTPFHCDRGLTSDVSLGSLLCVAFCGLEMGETLLGQHHYCLYYLASAIQPRMLYTVDEEGKPLPVPVRVGEAIDVVGQAGKPKSITGFQTHTTPVLMSVTDRAELATDEYISYTPFLEGVAILRKNPEVEEEGSG